MTELLEMSLRGGVLIAAILLVRALCVNRLPKRAFLLLWAAAFLSLMVPLHISSPVSVYSAAQYLGAPVRRGGLLLPAPGAAPARAAHAVSPAVILWAAGALLLALGFLMLHLRGRGKYRASLPVENPFVSRFLEAHRIRRPVQVRYSDQIGSPLTYGILYPVILLPKGFERMGEERLAFVLSHELCHIRRFDVLGKWLLAAMLCVHWFNPLVAVMYLLASRDVELSCDEAVIRGYGLSVRSAYALTLVELEEQRTVYAPLESGFSRSTLKERITAVMKVRPVTGLRAAAAMLLVCGVTTVFATSAPAEEAVPEIVKPSTVQPGPVLDGPVLDGPVLDGSVLEPLDWDELWADDGVPSYTQAQYDALIARLKPDGYPEMSLAAFNRSVHAAMSSEGAETLYMLYEVVLNTLPEDDPNAAFLRNTVSASLNEYDARLSEVFSGKRSDPQFYATAQAVRNADVFGEQVMAGVCYADYSFSYRILDQDALTVAERDAFLQRVMQAAQDFCEKNLSGRPDEDGLREALKSAGAEASDGKISFVDCEIFSLDCY